VHDYLNLDMGVVLDLVHPRRHHFIRDFLMEDVKLD
jgi:hypothetical protein